MKSRRWPIKNNNGKEVGYGIGDRVFDDRGIEVGIVLRDGHKHIIKLYGQPDREIRLHGCQLDNDTGSLDHPFQL